MVATETVGFVFLATGVALLFLLREPLRYPEKPGSKGFALALVGVSLWPLSLGVNYFVTDLGASIALWNVRIFAASLISIAWLLVAVHVTSGRSPRRRLVAPLVAYLCAGVVITWTNPHHHLVLAPETAVTGTILSPVFGPWFWIQAAINYGLILAGTALFTVEWSQSTGLRRRQAAVLAAAVVPPSVTNLFTIFGVVPTVHDLTPFGLVGSGVLLSWALYRVGFLDIVPVARETAMDVMQDPVVTLDDDDRVVDCNRAARHLFGVSGDYVGTPAPEFFDPLSAEVRDRFVGVDGVHTEVSTTVQGERRHYSVSTSSIGGPGERTGRVIVLRDVTPIKSREQALEARQAELDLLQQVHSRVLRHNIRNEVTKIRGNAGLLDEVVPDRSSDRVESIVAASDALLAISEKARVAERVVDGPDDPVEHDLREVVDRAVETVGERYPSVSFAVEGEATCPVTAVDGLDAAVEALVENAAGYNDSDDPHVRVSVDDGSGGPTLAVADDGPGIPEHEVTVIEAGEETPLSHGSGIGLWIVRWVADRSGADLAFETGEEGSTVSLHFG